jgi:hypothetical protein
MIKNADAECNRCLLVDAPADAVTRISRAVGKKLDDLLVFVS